MYGFILARVLTHHEGAPFMMSQEQKDTISEIKEQKDTISEIKEAKDTISEFFPKRHGVHRSDLAKLYFMNV